MSKQEESLTLRKSIGYTAPEIYFAWWYGSPTRRTQNWLQFLGET
jgi:hypothetical protein